MIVESITLTIGRAENGWEVMTDEPAQTFVAESEFKARQIAHTLFDEFKNRAFEMKPDSKGAG